MAGLGADKNRLLGSQLPLAFAEFFQNPQVIGAMGLFVTFGFRLWILFVEKLFGNSAFLLQRWAFEILLRQVWPISCKQKSELLLW